MKPFILVPFALVACGGGGSSSAMDASAGAPDVGVKDGDARLDDVGQPASGDAETRDAPSSSADAAGGTTCAGDTKVPFAPAIPLACATLEANQSAVVGKTVPAETTLDTARIQTALGACATGHAVRLAAMGANNAFVSGPLTLPSGVSLWIDSGATLYASRNASLYGAGCGTGSGACVALVTSTGSGSGIFGEGAVNGQGGELMLGQTQSWWDLSNSLAASGGSSANPALVQTQGAKNFTLYGITLNDSPKFHVKLDAAGFLVWGVTIITPSTATNSQGTALSAADARNTDGIDPGESASNGYIVCSKISNGDDQIAIKGGTSVTNLTIAHNHFGSGHGMSIGSETNGGVSNIDVYDLSIDGTTTSGIGGSSSNGIRIKSGPSEGGLVSNVTYTDVCVRDLVNPILLTPRYSTTPGSLIPEYTGITIRQFRSIGSSVTPNVTLDGYDSAHLLGLTLDNVIIDDIDSSHVTASYAKVTLGPGSVNFTPAGSEVTVTDDVSGATTPNDCTGKWVTF